MFYQKQIVKMVATRANRIAKKTMMIQPRTPNSLTDGSGGHPIVASFPFFSLTILLSFSTIAGRDREFLFFSKNVFRKEGLSLIFFTKSNNLFGFILFNLLIICVITVFILFILGSVTEGFSPLPR